jgi:N-sulfoglucosamine sulfohydrolase
MQVAGATDPDPGDRPNILWLTFEDTDAGHLSAYGNSYTHMPTLDSLAEQGIRFTQARATAPHCSPARASIISGSYATTYGTDWHRKPWPVPHDQYYFPALLQQAGYYTTNNRKTDYNAKGWRDRVDQIWSRQGSEASYNNDQRAGGQPFFAVFNQLSTHMGRIRSFHLEGRPDFDGIPPVDSLRVPPYVPDLEAVRSDYGFELEGLNELDRWIGRFVEDLKERGLFDDTIIFVYSDHGGPLPNTKGYPYDRGVRVPLIVHVPPKWRDRIGLPTGRPSDRLVGFEDLGPTVLRLAGVDVPEHMQGRDVLSPEAEPKTYQYTFRTNHGPHFYPVRAVTNGQYRYIRFYMPHKPLGLRQFYQWGNPSYQAWDRLCHETPDQCPSKFAQWFRPKPTEYLFNIQEDPWEMNNLADDPEHKDMLKQMRGKVSQHLRETKDLGLFPQTTRLQGDSTQPLYDQVRQEGYPLDSLYAAAETASRGNPTTVDALIGYLQSDRPSIRFWGASGFATLSQRGEIREVPPALIKATDDPNAEVAVTAAEALVYLGQAERGMAVILETLETGTFPARSTAGSSLQGLAEVRPSAVRPYVAQLRARTDNQHVRSALITLGELPYGRLYRNVYEQGLEVNRNRQDWRNPSPNPTE